jgi:iron complex outermembrane receptor protein
MKKAMGVTLAFTAHFLVCQGQKTETKDSTLLQPVEIIALRASVKTPVSATTLQAAEIEKYNTGRDLPFLLNLTPSVVVNADAGNGVGYTGIRIRGTDATRINVTINNIPYNDAESQGTFFVDVPDLASSASSIQIQRGVGTSTNGTGAFGGSINISTNDIRTKRKLELSQSAGSYNTLKNTLSWNSGLLDNRFTVDGRLSRISSDGFIDRAFSKLYSGYLSTALITKKYSLRFNVIHGQEKTYQAWYGIREDILDTNRTFNQAGTEKPGTPYDNETDNYKQTHYQAFQNISAGKYWKASLALFLTRGKGYYEQYKADQALQDYGLPDYQDSTGMVSHTDLIRRLWLDNYFYGSLLTLKYNKGKSEIISGAGWTRYDGKNYGEVVRSIITGAAPSGYRWYSLDARKTEVSAFSKWEYHLTPLWTLYADGQVRSVHYRVNGFRFNPQLVIDNNYLFFNPKIGITFSRGITTAYMSFARAAKEPNRDDFEASKNEQPRPEILNDLEAGAEIKNKKIKFSGNLYYMNYHDQLVLTGRINDVGAYARTNIPESYRAGIELSGSWICNRYVTCFGSATISRNRIRNFTEFVDDYDSAIQRQYTYKETDLSYSPSLIATAGLTFSPIRKLTLSFDGKYVSRQYLDNTSRKERSLKPFVVSNMKLDYELKFSGKINTSWFLQCNNLFSEKYEPNGYTFSYIYGGQSTTENYYYPMAPFNILAGIKVTME